MVSAASQILSTRGKCHDVENSKISQAVYAMLKGGMACSRKIHALMKAYSKGVWFIIETDAQRIAMVVVAERIVPGNLRGHRGCQCVLMSLQLTPCLDTLRPVSIT